MVTNTKAQEYYMMMLPIIEDIVINHPKLKMRDLHGVIMSGLEKICRRVNQEHQEELKINVSLRVQLKHILDFMIRHESAYASGLKSEL